ncbi:MAG: BLUF domain-containing protein [Janthinobacterium lividum]
MSEAVCVSKASVSGNRPNLSTLVYRSRATRPLTPAELLDLTKVAERRNRAESITGLMLYDDSSFFQWLEGPDDAVARVMHSITGDTRHTDIEVLTRRPTARRNFHGWSMKLALADGVRSAGTREVITPPPKLLAALHRRPERAAHILARLAPMPGSAGRVTALESIVTAEIVPRLLQTTAGARLAGLLRADDVDAALALVRSATGPADGSSIARTALFTAAARDLGDGWSRDDCTELDVSLGLFTLHAVMRQLDRRAPADIAFAGLALVAPQSGEPHALGAAMSAQTLRAGGWQVRCEFPDNDDELAALLADTWFDRLDLSLSPAHDRLDRLGDLTSTIAMARLASPNRALNVAVGGRAFIENAGLAARVGADLQTRG